MTTKTFETLTEAKDHCLAQFCTPCGMKQICNYELSEAKEAWRKCLGVRQGLCPHYQPRGTLLNCKNPQMSTDFCLGKQCKSLPAIEIEEEQKVPSFRFGASAPSGPDYKQRSAHDIED